MATLVFAVLFDDPAEMKPECGMSPLLREIPFSTFKRKKVFLQTLQSQLNRGKELMKETPAFSFLQDRDL